MAESQTSAPTPKRQKLVSSISVPSLVQYPNKTYTFLWTIKNFSSWPSATGFSDIKSPEFPEDGANEKWCLKMKNTSGILDVYLELVASTKGVLHTVCKLSLVDIDFCKIDTHYKKYAFHMRSNKLLSFNRFLQQEVVLRSSDGLLPNGHLVLYGEIYVVEYESEDCSLPISPRDSATRHMDSLFKNRYFPDFVIQVKGKKFPCHKAILSCRSNFFSAMLKSDMKEREENKHVVTDIEPDVFEKLLCYIYTGKVSVSENEAVELLMAADKYLITQLKTTCEKKLISFLCLENAVQMLRIADYYDLQCLKRTALCFATTFSKPIREFDNYSSKKVQSHKNDNTESLMDITLDPVVSCEKKDSKLNEKLKDEDDIMSMNDLTDSEFLTIREVKKRTRPPPADSWCCSVNHIVAETIWKIKELNRYYDTNVNQIKTSHVCLNARDGTIWQIKLKQMECLSAGEHVPSYSSLPTVGGHMYPVPPTTNFSTDVPMFNFVPRSGSTSFRFGFSPSNSYPTGSGSSSSGIFSTNMAAPPVSSGVVFRTDPGFRFPSSVNGSARTFTLLSTHPNPNFIFHPTKTQLFFYLSLISSKEEGAFIEYKISIINADNKEKRIIIGSEYFMLNSCRKVGCIDIASVLSKSNEILHNGDLVFSFSLMTRKSFVYDLRSPVQVEDNVQDDVATLLTDDDYPDLTIRVENSSFRCHKAILASRSSYLASQLRDLTSSVLTVEDVQPDMFKNLLNYIYTSKWAFVDTEPSKYLPLANKYCLYQLKSKCEDVLIMQLSIENAADTLIFADSNNANRLRKCSVHFIANFVNEVMCTPGWSEIMKYKNLFTECLNACAVPLSLSESEKLWKS